MRVVLKFCGLFGVLVAACAFAVPALAGTGPSVPIALMPAAPTIDGTNAFGEWDAATSFPVTFGTLTGTAHVGRTATDFFFMLDVDDPANAATADTALYFDNGNDGTLAPGDDILGLNQGFAPLDFFFETVSPSSLTSRPDTAAGGTDDIAAVSGVSAGHHIVEYRHPLCSGDTGHDFCFLPPAWGQPDNAIGFTIVYAPTGTANGGFGYPGGLFTVDQWGSFTIAFEPDTTPPPAPQLSVTDTTTAYYAQATNVLWYRGGVADQFTLVASGNDPESGIDHTNFPQATDLGTGWDTGASTATSLEYFFPSSGVDPAPTGPFDVTLVNGALAEGPATQFTFDTDGNAPTGGLDCNPAACLDSNGPVTVTVTATDNGGSGIRELRYTTDGSDPGPGTGTLIQPGGSFTVNYPSTTVKLWGSDNVGNEGQIASASVSGSFATLPNGSILYQSTRPTPADDTFSTLWEANPATGAETQLVSTIASLHVDVAHDGSKLAWTGTNVDGQSFIVVGDRDGKNAQNITSGPADDWAAISPDGTKIAYAHLEADNTHDIYVAGIDGSNPQNITNTNGLDEIEPSWSPDGTAIAYAKWRQIGEFFDYDVMTQSPVAAGGTVTDLTINSTVDDRHPSWSPKGTLIAYSSKGAHTWPQVWTMNRDGSNPQILTDSYAGFNDTGDQNSDPSFSPDGTKIAFVFSPGGTQNFDVFTMNANGTGRTRLFTNGTHEGYPAWAPLAASNTLTVNTTSDHAPDGCTTADCTLREAITAANAQAGPDTIDFNIPGSGVQTITPTSPLPAITDPVTIDGYTQPGASANTLDVGDNATLQIVLHGTAATSTAPGVDLQAADTTVRGLVVNGAFIYGISASGTGATNNTIAGNFIGTDATGTSSQTPGIYGVGIFQGASGNTVGGESLADRNVISGVVGSQGSNGDGIGIGTGAHDNTVEGNYIGTNAAGTAAVPNAGGIAFTSTTTGNEIFGNVIAGNSGDGVYMQQAGGASPTTGNDIFENKIGVAADGSARGNAGAGVDVQPGVTNTQITNNEIAFNGNTGVTIVAFTPQSFGISILGNTIHDNAGLGIDLGGDGVTPNDATDGDTGPNNLQNFPVITESDSSHVAGTLAGPAGTSYTIEIFQNATCDPSGHGEGATLVGSTTAFIPGEIGSGTANWSFLPDGSDVPTDGYLTATATSSQTGDTSEFSACLVPALSSIDFTVDQSTTNAGASSFALGSLPPELFQQLAGAINAAPIPSAPIPSAAVGASPIPSAPIPSAPIPSAPIPSAPIPDAPIPSAPIPSAPIPSAGLGGLPIPSASTPNPLDAIMLSSLPGLDVNALFVGTDMAGRLPQQYTLGDIYRAKSLADNTTLLALNRFNLLKVTQLPLSQTFLRGVRTLSYLLGGKTLGQINLPNGQTWCAALTANGGSCLNVNLATTTVIGLDIMQQLGTLDLGHLTVASLTNGLNGTLVGEALLARISVLRTTLAAVRLSSLAPNANTFVDCSRISCLGTATLGDAAKLVPTALRDNVPLKSLGAAANGVTLNELVVALMPRNAFPWEQESYIGWQGFNGQAQQLQYHLAFDTRCPVAGLTIRVGLPFGFLYLPGSSTLQSGTASPVALADPTNDSESDDAIWSNVSVPTCASGLVQHMVFNFKGLPGYKLGASPSTASISVNGGDASVTGAPVLVQRNWTAALDRSTAPTIAKDTIILSHVDHTGATNYFRLPEQGRGKLVTIYMRPPDGVDLDLYVVRPAPDSLLASPIPSAPIPSAPIPSAPIPSAPIPSASTSVNTTTDNPPPELLDDGPLPGGQVAVNSITRGDGVEVVTFRQAGTTGFDEIAVAGYNGAFSSQPFSLRVQVDDPAPLPATCPVRTFANKLSQAGQLPVGQLPSSTQALALVNVGRMNAMYGAAATSTMLTKLNAVMATPSVNGKVLQIDGDSGVFAASKAWDQSPCSIDAVNAYVKAINVLVAKYRGNLTNLRSITIVGNDEQIPFARVLDFVPTSSEFDNTGALSFMTQGGTVDNATYAAAGLGYVLTDDAYGAFHTRTLFGHEFFLPEVALGRLVETPPEIQAQLQRFINSTTKTLDASTGLVTGYDFMSDGAKTVHDNLATRIVDPAKNTLLQDTWGKSALASFLTAGGATAPKLDSWNAHYDFYRLMPAVFSVPDDLITTSLLPSPVVTPRFDGDIFFTMGCHAGETIADTLTSDTARRRDWAQAYAQHGAAVFVGNTGYGFGDTASVALSERMMTQFAGHLGFSGSIGEKFMTTKNEYFASMGAYGPYDQKSLSEATFYGLPFWGLNSPPEPTPTPPGPVTADGTTGLSVAPLTINPTLTRVDDARGTFWKGGSGVVFVPGRSVQPLETSEVTQPASSGLVAHGFFPTALTTHDVLDLHLYFAKPIIDLGAHEPKPQVTNDTFPANILKVAQTDYLGRRHSTIDLIAGQSRPGSTPSLQNERLIDSVSGNVTYAPASNNDYTPPLFMQNGALVTGGNATIFATVKDESSGGVIRVRAFYTTGGPWQFVDLQQVSGVPNAWRVTTPVSAPKIEVGFVAEDAAGNTGWMTDKGNLVTSFTGTAPESTISIDRPLDGGTFALGQTVPAGYSCSGPAGVASCVGTVPNGAPIDTSSVGVKHFSVTATPLLGDPTTEDVTYEVGYAFGGFLSPITSGLNSASAGNSVPIKFSLHGNYGLGIFAPGYPLSASIRCEGGAVDMGGGTQTSGNSTLQYDARTDVYTYSWKTDKAWLGTCRELLVGFRDGSIRRAYFQFK